MFQEESPSQLSHELILRHLLRHDNVVAVVLQPLGSVLLDVVAFEELSSEKGHLDCINSKSGRHQLWF